MKKQENPIHPGWRPPPAWEKADTMAWLSKYPLPPTFMWEGRLVRPTYRIKGGWGKWLAETPYHPGLFELIHEIIVGMGEALPTPEELQEKLREIERVRNAQGELF